MELLKPNKSFDPPSFNDCHYAITETVSNFNKALEEYRDTSGDPSVSMAEMLNRTAAFFREVQSYAADIATEAQKAQRHLEKAAAAQ